MKSLAFAAVIALAAAAPGCKKKQEPTGNAGPSLLPPAAASGARAVAPAATTAPGPAIVWTDPPNWKRSPRQSPMRMATYQVPHAPKDKEDAELGVFYFGPGQGGTIDANVDRWVKQFSDVPVEKVKRADRSVNGLVQHTVEVDSGTFNASAMMQGPAKPKPNYALLGAIVEAPTGEYFFKLTGPADTIAAARADFYRLLDSVHIKPS